MKTEKREDLGTDPPIFLYFSFLFLQITHIHIHKGITKKSFFTYVLKESATPLSLKGQGRIASLLFPVLERRLLTCGLKYIRLGFLCHRASLIIFSKSVNGCFFAATMFSLSLSVFG